MATDDEFFAHLDSIGEDEVRRQVARDEYGTPGSQRRSVVELWLRLKAESRARESASRKESREEMSLLISRRALRVSWLATIIAATAIILNISDKSDQFVLFLQRLGVLKPYLSA